MHNEANQSSASFPVSHTCCAMSTLIQISEIATDIIIYAMKADSSASVKFQIPTKFLAETLKFNILQVAA